MTVKDIKDKTPNESLIKNLESLLDSAKKGEVRSAAWVSCWDNNCTSHAWVIDDRSYRKLILTEMLLLEHEYMTNLQAEKEDSVLNQVIEMALKT